MRTTTLTAIVFTVACATQADTVTQIGDNDTTGQNWNDTGADWSNEEPASPGNDYISSGGFILRTTYLVNSTFAGDSLTVENGSTLQLRQGVGNTSTVSNLILNDGAIIAQASGNGVLTLDGGTLTVGTGTADLTVDNNRGIMLEFDSLAGDGLLKFNRSGTGADISDNSISIDDASSFTGTIQVSFGDLEFSASGTGDYNQAEFIINNSAYATATITLSRSITVSSLYFTDTETYVDPGTYTTTELNAISGESTFSGVGTLTLIPEPREMSLWCGGLVLGMIVLQVRRRMHPKG